MAHNPYTPPHARVDGAEEKTPFDFSGEIEYSFTSKQLWWAGVCCLLGVLITVPYFAMAFLSESAPSLKFFSLATAYAMTLLSIYPYLIFKKLLIEKSRYRGASLAISLYILIEIVTALTAHLYGGEAPSTFDTILFVVQLVMFGATVIFLGLMLLRCEDDLFGQAKQIAYLTIAMGIALLSAVLALFGVLLSIPLGIAMAKMFFSASKALEKAQA